MNLNLLPNNEAFVKVNGLCQQKNFHIYYKYHTYVYTKIDAVHRPTTKVLEFSFGFTVLSQNVYLF